MAKGSGGLLCEWILYTQSKHRPQWMLLPSEVWLGIAGSGGLRCFSFIPPLRSLGLTRLTISSAAQTWGWQGEELRSRAAYTHNFSRCPPPLR